MQSDITGNLFSSYDSTWFKLLVHEWFVHKMYWTTYMYVCNESTQDAGPLALLIKLIVNNININWTH